eukprot:354080-Chlamydomonas_euryale.AAC.5
MNGVRMPCAAASWQCRHQQCVATHVGLQRLHGCRWWPRARRSYSYRCSYSYSLRPISYRSDLDLDISANCLRGMPSMRSRQPRGSQRDGRAFSRRFAACSRKGGPAERRTGAQRLCHLRRCGPGTPCVNRQLACLVLERGTLVGLQHLQARCPPYPRRPPRRDISPTATLGAPQPTSTCCPDDAQCRRCAAARHARGCTSCSGPAREPPPLWCASCAALCGSHVRVAGPAYGHPQRTGAHAGVQGLHHPRVHRLQHQPQYAQQVRARSWTIACTQCACRGAGFLGSDGGEGGRREEGVPGRRGLRTSAAPAYLPRGGDEQRRRFLREMDARAARSNDVRTSARRRCRCRRRRCRGAQAPKSFPTSCAVAVDLCLFKLTPLPHAMLPLCNSAAGSRASCQQLMLNS